MFSDIAARRTRPSAALRKLFSAAEDLSDTPAGIVCLHGILEGLLLAELRTCRDFWRNIPSVHSLFRSVAIDEARHVAFGRHWMAKWRAHPELSACDPTLAGVVSSFRACLELDEGYSKLSARRRREFDEIGAVHLSEATEPLAAALTSLALPRSAREVRRLLQE